MNFEFSSRWRSRCAVFLPIVLVVYLGHYLRLFDFGLYEDDYWSLVPNLNQPLSYLSDVFVGCFRAWPTGRPLNHFLPVALAIIGFKLGGLAGIYTLACGWLTLNALLVYGIVRRLFSYPSALLAAFVYVLFPADTTKILLIHAAHVQGSMTFLLLGIFLWQSGRVWRWLSYPVLSLSLMSYESAFLPFLAVPLLWAGERKATVRTWLFHLSLCAAIVALIAFIRLRTGDVRAGTVVANPSDTLHMLLTSLYLGPLTSGRMLGEGAWIGIRQIGVVGGIAAAFLAWVVYLLRPTVSLAPERSAQPLAPIWPDWLARARTETGRLPWWWIFFAAVLMLSGSYALTLTNYPPTQEFGRMTSTHVAAGWGMALAVAALFEGARINSGKQQLWLIGIVGLWVGALLLYQDFNQREYVRAWRIQQDFWRQVATLSPEAGPDWSIIVTGDVTRQRRVIASNSWADFHLARELFNPDPTANTPAFAHLGVIGHLVHFENNDGNWEWNPRFWGGPPDPLDRNRLILLHSENGILHRITAIDTMAGRLESAAPLPDHPRTVWPPTTLARLLFPEQFLQP